MRNPFEPPPRPSSPERESADPKKREQKLLERFQSPAGRWLSMAAIALSTEGCANFKPVIQGLTLETGPVAGHDWEIKNKQDDFSVSFTPTFEQSGDRAWWNKRDGIYLSPEAREAYREKLMAREATRQNPMRTEKPPEVREIPPEAFVSFTKDERKPRETVVYMHRRGQEPLATTIGRGIDLMLEALPPDAGLRLTWHEETKRGPTLTPTIPAGEHGYPPAAMIYPGKEEDRAAALKGLEHVDEEVARQRQISALQEGITLQHTLRKQGDKLRPMIPGAFIWTDETWSSFPAEQALNHMLATPPPQVETAYRMSPLVDVPTRGKDAPTTPENAAIAEAFSMREGLGFSQEASRLHPDLPAQVVGIVKRRIPPIALLPDDPALQHAREEAAFTMTKRSALRKAAEHVMHFGTGDTRLHVLVNPARTHLVVVFVMDDPSRIPSGMKWHGERN